MNAIRMGSREGRAKSEETSRSIDLRAEYKLDYSKAVRGKYLKRILKDGANVVVLEPDIAKVFPDSAAVNDTLRLVIKAARATRKAASRVTRRIKRTA
jgi:hypothetical protein